jgi:hypothetical protein
MIDEGLKEWATPRQIEYIDAINKAGGWRKAAKALGINSHQVLMTSIKNIKARAAKQGYSPKHDMTHTVPSPFVVRGTSTLYDEDGKAKLQWVKTRLDEERVEQAIREAIDALSQDVIRVNPVQKPKNVSQSLANLYTLTDCHVGMKAWAAECGDDWDLTIAEQVLSAAFGHLIDSCPPAKIGIVNQLGDFLHFDSLDSVTPQHRNLLDSDSRFPKVVSVAVRILRHIISTALTKHEQIIVVISEGNHDMASSVWLRHLFSLLFENEPRVKVIDEVTPYFALSLGNTMLAFHHGHLSKNTALPMLFAATYPKMWGETTKRYCHTGHRHHVEEKEHNGMTVIQHPTIAARDAYAARGGWIADRAMTAITYHEKYGQVARTTVTPEMLQ